MLAAVAVNIDRPYIATNGQNRLAVGRFLHRPKFRKVFLE